MRILCSFGAQNSLDNHELFDSILHVQNSIRNDSNDEFYPFNNNDYITNNNSIQQSVNFTENISINQRSTSLLNDNLSVNQMTTFVERKSSKNKQENLVEKSGDQIAFELPKPGQYNFGK